MPLHFFSDNAGKQMKSVWTMSAPNNGEKNFGKHPTQKPVALLERIITARNSCLLIQGFPQIKQDASC
ncbi:MAG: hypothetical protein JNK95_14650 [Candidatus Competibacter sp.]|nr:hypothetical protein [Candidatus Competibacter sp.]